MSTGTDGGGGGVLSRQCYLYKDLFTAMRPAYFSSHLGGTGMERTSDYN